MVSDIAMVESTKYLARAASYDFLGLLFALGFFLILLVAIVEITRPSKSKKYRRLISDMFVAGRIKQLASEKKIDISEEFEEFKRFLKKQKLDDSALDYVIEQELMEEVQENNDKGGLKK